MSITVYVNLYDDSPNADTPYVYVFSEYGRALEHACAEIMGRIDNADDLLGSDENAQAIYERAASDKPDDNERALVEYASACEGGRFVMIETRAIDEVEAPR